VVVAVLHKESFLGVLKLMPYWHNVPRPPIDKWSVFITFISLP